MTSISALDPTPCKACNISPLNLPELILRPCLLLLTLSRWETVDTALPRRHFFAMSGAEETLMLMLPRLLSVVTAWKGSLHCSEWNYGSL